MEAGLGKAGSKGQVWEKQSTTREKEGRDCFLATF